MNDLRNPNTNHQYAAQLDQLDRMLAYMNFEPSVVKAECEDCGIGIPVELILCEECKFDREFKEAFPIAK